MDDERRYFAAGADLEDERSRLRLLEQTQDPVTTRHLTSIGVGQGWRCLEVGAGGGSIARWLADRIGPSGHVVATDIDPRFLDALDVPNVEVRRHDIAVDDLEEDAYDVVHCRALLLHVRAPEAVVTTMVRALRPGGWLLVEEPDFGVLGPVDDAHPLAGRFNAHLERAVGFVQSNGIMNLFVGRRLPPLLARLGLTDTANEAVTQVVQGGSPTAVYLEKSMQRLDETMLDNGILSPAEIADRSSVLVDPTFWFVNYMRVSAWGRRPPL